MPRPDSPDVPALSGTDDSGFDWNNLVSSFFSNAGNILQGIAGIVVGSNNSNHTTTLNTNTTLVDSSNRSTTNGATVTAIAIGGLAVVVALILVLGK